jgi:DNA-binding XRE family transcriptional regulator
MYSKQHLKDRRKEIGLSQSKLSNFLEISLPTYEKMETGNRPIPKKHHDKLKMYQDISDINILIGIYKGETITKVYAKLIESKGNKLC